VIFHTWYCWLSGGDGGLLTNTNGAFFLDARKGGIVTCESVEKSGQAVFDFEPSPRSKGRGRVGVFVLRRGMSKRGFRSVWLRTEKQEASTFLPRDERSSGNLWWTTRMVLYPVTTR